MGIAWSERKSHFIRDVTNERSQLFENLWECDLGGDSKRKGNKTSRKVIVADAYDGEKRRSEN